MTETLTAVGSEAGQRLNRRQVAKQRTRQKVLDAARGLFAERGYEPATIRDIAKGAGMSTGAVFANFQDKAELFEAVLVDEMDRLAQVASDASGGDEAVDQRLAAVMAAVYHASLDHLPLMQAIVARSWFQPQEAEVRARKAVEPLVAVFTRVLQDGLRRGELRQDADLQLLGTLTWDVYLSNYRRAAYDEWDAGVLAEQAQRQVELLLSGVRTNA
ncbi:TetR/AcrR family transcriptional regulator [Brevundimonas sp. PAMC22021]|uniref:TetR/AcrR family transcriptional regulator n=1 Tax=Brevundimonas sp. PAMC22021 TaxID=2861285 RepID=UPI001C635781|nr:TetR/AcrR family transcriptional regulator [Brevundimonas sp. PAMC22021]QYF86613.1 TetR/AcrR family transcriptional regulator [Brevundimonas sp. PAMC22021]